MCECRIICLCKVSDKKVFCKKSCQIICSFEKKQYLCIAIKQRAFSSAGSEHLPYKQRVGGSNPSTPTKPKTRLLKSSLFLSPTPTKKAPIHSETVQWKIPGYRLCIVTESSMESKTKT